MSPKTLKRTAGLFFLAVAVLVIAGVVAFHLLWRIGPVPQGEPTPRPEGAGWIDLLDEAHAAGWANVTDDKDIFELENGMLHIYGRSLLPLRYVGYRPETFGDFDLHVEFKMTRHANSGVFLRANPSDPVNRGIEIQVQDDYGKRPNKNRCGAVYDVVTPMFNMARPAGEWNSYDISLRGPELEVVMNGWLIVHTDLSKMTNPIGKFPVPLSELSTTGLLAFQDHGGEVWYRNILISKQ